MYAETKSSVQASRVVAQVSLAIGLTGLAIYWAIWRGGDAGTEFADIAWLQLLPALVVAWLIVVVQCAATMVFVRAEVGALHTGTVASFVASKGLVNLVLPASIGTIVLLPRFANQTGTKMLAFLRFMVAYTGLFSGATLVLLVSLAGYPLVGVGIAMLGLTLLWLGRSAAGAAFQGFRVLQMCILSGLQAALFISLTVALLLVFQLNLALFELIGVAGALSLSSTVNVTPGNFGVRELLVAAFADLRDLPVLSLVLLSILSNVVRAVALGALLLLALLLPDVKPVHGQESV